MELARLETKNLRLEFNKNNGSLVGIYSKVSNWNVIKRPELGMSWRMMLPLEDKRNNEAWGNEQKKPECQVSEDCITFTWDKIETRFGGVHDVTVVTKCSIEKDQAVFRMHIDNKDKCIVENVYYPYIGDLHRPNNAKRFKLEHGYYCHMKEYEMYPTFPDRAGTCAVDYPTICLKQANENPPMNPVGLISDDAGNGLFLGVADRRMEAVTWHAECLPGWRNSNQNLVFEEDKVGDKDVYVRFAIGHLPYVAPGTTFDLLPFAMDAYKGNWSVGMSCYKRWSQEWSKVPDTMPEWAKNPHSWFQIHINSPEDELRIKYKDLPKIGEECKKYGVKAIQLVGWNHGGQDRGNPYHDTDPRLGTFEELKQAIREIQEMGVKVILFSKFTWADQANEDFKEVYEKLAIKNPYDNYYVYEGYQYMTLSQLADVSTRRLVPMCFGSEEYMEICKREFQKCVDLGADGILFDECQHHSPALCCFDTSHGHRYGEMCFKWDEKLIEGFREIVKGKEFLFAGESLYDFQHNYYDLSYTRTWGRDHKPVTRMIRPDCNIMSAVIGFNDREMINQCLLNKYIISYEPYMFKGMLSDYPLTVAYGNKMDKLRTDLREYFWDGTFMEKQGGTVSLANGEVLDSYTVYDGTNGKQGMIICNYSDQPITVIPKLTSGAKLTKYRLVDDDEMTGFDQSFVIPADSAAAVI